ncbi:hypothetical protein [Nodosilinea sp. P-1105]|uniref:hypothetical protein n=1 Tax=Nodosilinea sp. P-1105 TaxID=2546229 RepID=UPI00146D1104|nr:hypothetical protein [Nodosilinea sp. P-1105]NMF82805.1 hypothetical protein [Nodosilinea sp. P-1105]
MDWFPRRHAIVLARSSLGRLAYLEKTGIIVPQRAGLPQRPTVLYSWEQILEIRAISRLRQHLSFQAIRKIIQYFDDHGFDRSLRDKHLIIGPTGVTWICPGSHATPQLIYLAGKRNSPMGQFVLAPLDPYDASSSGVISETKGAKVIDIDGFREKLRSR